MFDNKIATPKPFEMAKNYGDAQEQVLKSIQSHWRGPPRWWSRSFRGVEVERKFKLEEQFERERA